MRPDPVKYLTGSLSSRPYPGGISLPGEGGKFTTGGEVQRWPGNTFICHVTRPSSGYSALIELQEEIKRSEFSTMFTWLPAPSFHMTVFQGCSPGNEGTAEWPSGLCAKATPDEANKLMLHRIDGLQINEHFRINAKELFCAHSLTVEGIDDETNFAMRELRKQLRSATGISPPDFESYIFHITIGYLVQWLSRGASKEVVEFSNQLYARYAGDLQQIELDTCAFCNFDTLHAFSLVKN